MSHPEVEERLLSSGLLCGQAAGTGTLTRGAQFNGATSPVSCVEMRVKSVDLVARVI